MPLNILKDQYSVEIFSSTYISMKLTHLESILFYFYSLKKSTCNKIFLWAI